MNARQRRKSWRSWKRVHSIAGTGLHIAGWADLAKVPESETHRLEIDVESCNGWVIDKRDPNSDDYLSNCNFYLSTHTFYGSQHQRSTARLRKCGFNVTLENWDA